MLEALGWLTDIDSADTELVPDLLSATSKTGRP